MSWSRNAAIALLGFAAARPLAAQIVRIVPGLANAAGANGTRFESTLYLTSFGADTTVDLEFIPYAGEVPPAPVTRSLKAGQTLRVDNAVASLFGLSGKAGTLRLRSAQPFGARAVTANVAGASGTYGLGIPSVPAENALAAGEIGHAVWASNSLDASKGYRTNVAVVLLSKGAVHLTVYDDGGVVRGETTVSSEGPVSWQRAIGEIARDADLPAGRVEMKVLAGSALGYTAVVDNSTGDGIAVPFETVSSTGTSWLLDGVARTAGQNGTQWSTDLRLYNPGPSAVDVSIQPVGLAGATGAVRTVGPRSVVEVADVVAALGLGNGVAGAVRLSGARPFLVAARTSNVDPAGRPGTFSAGVRPLAPAALLSAGARATFAGLEQTSGGTGFRTNLAFLGSAAGASGTLSLLDPAGLSLATAPVAVGADQWMQKGLADWFPGTAIPKDARADLQVSAGALDAYASVIDNGSGDPVVLAPVPVPGGGCAVPAPSLTASASSVPAGTSVTLALAGNGVANAVVTPGDLALAPGGSVAVTPAVTTAYRVTATGACGLIATAVAVVEVTAPAGTVRTGDGAVRGVTDGGVTSYKGIPYAAAPVGDLRWRAPAPVEPWVGVRDARAFGSVCPQFGDQGQGDYTGAEDCLFLNVFTPSAPQAAPLPVLFFIHGGGNVQGEGSSFVYDGAPLARTGPSVVVTLNYRLGTLGWLVQPFLREENRRGAAGNYGLLDQLAALSWVQRNIAAFGGDPSRVMVFGESAGGVNVCALVASPLARGLFSRALMESGGGCGQETLAKFQTFGDTIVKATPCAASAAPGPCLRALGAEPIVRAVRGVANVVSSSGQLFGPNVDGFVLTASPIDVIEAGQHNRVPFAIGANADETGQAAPAVATPEAYQALVLQQFGALLGALVLAQYPVTAFTSPRAAYVAVTTDARFVCTARRVARAVAANQPEPVYRYHFTHPLDNAGAIFKAYGAYHGLELFFVFRSLTEVGSYVPSAAELALADAMGRYWNRFGAAGDPNGGADVVWPRYDGARDTYLRLDSTTAAGEGVRTAACDFWDRISP